MHTKRLFFNLLTKKSFDASYVHTRKNQLNQAHLKVLMLSLRLACLI